MMEYQEAREGWRERLAQMRDEAEEREYMRLIAKGHYFGDAAKTARTYTIKQREGGRRKGLERWPRPCPTCYGEPGEPCVSQNGKRHRREHAARRRP